MYSSGINIIECEFQREEGSSKIKEINLIQKCDVRGDNRLRIHKLDIALYDENFNVHQIKGVFLSD